MNQSENVLGVRDVMRLLRLSRATVKRRAADGTIPATKLPGPRGQYLFDRSAVEALAKAGAR